MHKYVLLDPCWWINDGQTATESKMTRVVSRVGIYKRMNVFYKKRGTDRVHGTNIDTVFPSSRFRSRAHVITKQPVDLVASSSDSVPLRLSIIWLHRTSRIVLNLSHLDRMITSAQ